MYVVFIILNKLRVLDELMIALYNAGIRNGTVLDSVDMLSYVNQSDQGFFSDRLGGLLNNPYIENKTMFFIVNEEQVKVIEDVLHSVVGDLDTLQVASIFSFPLIRVQGVK